MNCMHFLLWYSSVLLFNFRKVFRQYSGLTPGRIIFRACHQTRTRFAFFLGFEFQTSATVECEVSTVCELRKTCGAIKVNVLPDFFTLVYSRKREETESREATNCNMNLFPALLVGGKISVKTSDKESIPKSLFSQSKTNKTICIMKSTKLS